MLDNNIYIYILYIYTNYLTFTGFSSDWKHLKDLLLSWGVRKSLRIEVFMKSNHRQLPIVWPSSSRRVTGQLGPCGVTEPPQFSSWSWKICFFTSPNLTFPFFFASFWFGGIQYFKNQRKISPSQVLSNPSISQVFRSPDSAQLGVFRKWFLERLLRFPWRPHPTSSAKLCSCAVWAMQPDVTEEFCYFEMVVL